jgi:release factor glutamine methyltransferase
MIAKEKKVFTPNATTELLVSCTLKLIKKNSHILDLGCGTGFVGLTVAKNSKFKNKYYFSDISKKAIELCKKNAKKIR